jgi:hypothetical protein
MNWPFRSTAEGVLLAAVGLNRLLGHTREFDSRFMGVWYGLIFCIGFFLLERALRGLPTTVSTVAQCAWIAVSCTAVYVPWFNTFYFDALPLAALTAALVGVGRVVLQNRVGALTLLLASCGLALIAGSKSQHSVIALASIPALWLPAGRQHFAPMWSRLLGTALITAGLALSIGTVPRSYAADAVFSALFYRVLPASPEPERILEKDTRIPPSWAAYSGQHAFDANGPLDDPQVRAHFIDWFGPLDLVRLYIRHPLSAWHVARVNLEESSLDRVRMKTGTIEHRLGNYEASAGKPPQTLSRFFCIWPSFKTAIIGDRPVVYLIYILVAVGAAWILAPPVARMRILLLIFTAMIILTFAVAMLDGVDAGKHLMIFGYLIDLTVCADATFAAWKLLGHNRFGHLFSPRH